MPQVNTNIRQAASSRDKASGKTLLKNGELLDVIIDWVQFTATLPSHEEFTAFWTSCFARMESKTRPTDFGEKKMAKYMKKNLFNEDGHLWTAPWCCGLGLLPPGITSFAPNAIEVQHRVLKGLLTFKTNSTVVLAFYVQGRHYEATQPLKVDEPAQKRLKVES